MRAILDILAFFLKLFRGSGTRVTLEARNEDAIERDRKRLEKLRAEVKRREDILNVVTHQIAFYKANANNVAADGLDGARRLRKQQFDDARDEYERAGGRWP